MTITEIWEAIDKNKKVHWHNSLYIVEPVKCEINKYSKLSFRDGKALRGTCTSNGFGSWIAESELKDVYISEPCPVCGSDNADLYWDENHETYECGSCGALKAI